MSKNYLPSLKQPLSVFFKVCFASVFSMISALQLSAQTSSPLNIKVNFQNAATTPPTGWLRDYGQSFGSRTSAYQGSGYSYGWIKRSDKTALDLTKNGRKRSSPSNILLATLIYTQADDLGTFDGTKIEGVWQAQIANGKYVVTVSVGDDVYYTG